MDSKREKINIDMDEYLEMKKKMDEEWEEMNKEMDEEWEKKKKMDEEWQKSYERNAKYERNNLFASIRSYILTIQKLATSDVSIFSSTLMGKNKNDEIYDALEDGTKKMISLCEYLDQYGSQYTLGFDSTEEEDLYQQARGIAHTICIHQKNISMIKDRIDKIILLPGVMTEDDIKLLKQFIDGVSNEKKELLDSYDELLKVIEKSESLNLGNTK